MMYDIPAILVTSILLGAQAYTALNGTCAAVELVLPVVLSSIMVFYVVRPNDFWFTLEKLFTLLIKVIVMMVGMEFGYFCRVGIDASGILPSIIYFTFAIVLVIATILLLRDIKNWYHAKKN